MANNELLAQVLGAIKANPKHWDQSTWRCDTGMCFAGWTGELSHEWNWEDSYTSRGFIRLDDGALEHNSVGNFAQDKLGLTSSQADALFNGYNNLEDLEAMVKELQNNPNADLGYMTTESKHRIAHYKYELEQRTAEGFNPETLGETEEFNKREIQWLRDSLEAMRLKGAPVDDIPAKSREDS